MDTHKVRTVLRGGEPWFHASDVCKVLGHANSSQALKDADVSTADKAKVSLGLRGSPPVFVSEAGLYDLIFTSRKQEARVFRKWVTGVVLPTLRKTGAYVVGEENITRPDLKAEHAADKQEITARTAMRLDGMAARKEWTAAYRHPVYLEV
jgi:prophage antirepressor-like protein